MGDDAYPRFRWLERGEGEPVLLLHGLMGEMDHWEATLDALADVCRPIAPVLPIFDPDFGEISLPALARFVVRFMDTLEIPRAVVGGNSLGGHIALELALSHPDRVSGLILTGSSGLFERSFTRGVPHVPGAAYVREKMEEVFYDPGLVTPEWVEAVRGIVTTRHLALRVLHVARAAKRHSVESRLGEILAPTLIVWGREDRITPPEVAEQFRARIPDARLIYLADCGHAPMLERPEAFNEVVRTWLGETRDYRHRAACVGSVR